jgi:WD40 repeat protein/mono/diheme cytochrome c family protein
VFRIFERELSVRLVCAIVLAVSLAPVARGAEAVAAPPEAAYAQVHALFAKHCLSCHDVKEAEADFVMDSYEALMKGGESGPSIVPGKASESLLVALIEQTKKPFMPPPKKGAKLSNAEIALIRAWIDAGAKPDPAGSVASTRPAALPRIEPRPGMQKRQPANAMAFAAGPNLYAVAGYRRVELRSGVDRTLVRTIEGLAGSVNDVAFTADGATLAIASGNPGVRGEIRLVKVADGSTLHAIDAHADAVYCIALSPDGKTLASGSYDQQVKLWDVATGRALRPLNGHNGAVFDVAFRPDGKTLATASVDRTVKLWDVATGERLDTLSESTKELYAVAWSADGSRVLAAGADNRIRAWAVSAAAKEGTNKIAASVFAHEGTILRLATSADGALIGSAADDKTVKLWDAASLAHRRALPPQPDWPTAVAFGPGGKVLAVGRPDGSAEVFSVADGTVVKPAPPAKPQLNGVTPRGVTRGATATLALAGKNLSGITAVTTSSPKLRASIKPGATSDSAATIEIAADADAPIVPTDLWVTGPGGESARVKLHVDTIPQLAEQSGEEPTPLALPCAAWGGFDQRGDADAFAFDARAGETVVLDVAAQRVGSKADVVLTVFDAAGRLLATVSDADDSPDPLFAFTPPADGRYVARVSELKAEASPEHFYKRSAGRFAVVTGTFPLSIPANADADVRLLGYNVPANAAARVKASPEGEAAVPLDPAVYRLRRELTVLVGVAPGVTEREPNDQPSHATPLAAVPGVAHGVLPLRADGSPDVDLFRFDATKGQNLILETLAARRGSPADTRIDVLHADGRPVERAVLRAVRDSWVTFRPIDANAKGARFPNYEEMELNQFVYFGGEVARLFLYPRGPDSEYDFYTTTGGKRRAYFDTTATSHALDEPCYIVEPHPPGETLPPTGLPSFRLHYANDDDADRRLGTDSLVHFTAPESGTYLARVTDSQGRGSDRAVYRLNVRPAKPDFSVTADGAAGAPFAGAGRSFTVRADRIDGFDGPIRVEVTGVPAGFTVSSPIVIEAGHLEAKGTIFADPDAKAPAGEAKPPAAVAHALIDGKDVSKPVAGFGKPGAPGKPKFTVELRPAKDAADSTTPQITIAPGQMVTAWLRIRRTDFKDRVSFDVENLPHGVIVADIGLNGILIPEGQSERQVFLKCAPWVEETDRLCYAKAREADGPTSKPVMVKVRKKP